MNEKQRIGACEENMYSLLYIHSLQKIRVHRCPLVVEHIALRAGFLIERVV